MTERERRAEQEGIGDIGRPRDSYVPRLFDQVIRTSQQDRFLTTRTKQQNKADTMIVQRPKCGHGVATNQVCVPPPCPLHAKDPEKLDGGRWHPGAIAPSHKPKIMECQRPWGRHWWTCSCGPFVLRPLKTLFGPSMRSTGFLVRCWVWLRVHTIGLFSASVH